MTKTPGENELFKPESYLSSSSSIQAKRVGHCRVLNISVFNTGRSDYRFVRHLMHESIRGIGLSCV
jgi:hypothetical protein